MTEKFLAYDITVEPVFIPGEGLAIEYLKEITMTVYAKDIHEAMKKAQDLLRIDSSSYEFTAVSRSGRASWSPWRT